MKSVCNTTKLIINADDLGISNSVNDPIFNSMSNHLITSSTLIANGPAIQSAITNLRDLGADCSFGVHLNITEFRPLKYTPGLKPILDRHGAFSNNIEQIALTSDLRTAIYIELCAQIELIQRYNIHISHIDSHNHIHTLPGLFLVIKKIQKKFDIRKVRITKNLYSESTPYRSRQTLFKKMFWIYLMKHYFSTITTAAFTDLLSFVKLVTNSPLKTKTIEVMVHPGNPEFADEMAFLESSHIKNILSAFYLINYNELH
jgi:chitin disaccharide deacetylase